MTLSHRPPWTHERSAPTLSAADLPFASAPFDREGVEREQQDLRDLAAQDPASRVLVMVGADAPSRDGRLVLRCLHDAPSASQDPAHPDVYLGRLSSGEAVVLRGFPAGADVADATDVTRSGVRALAPGLEPEELSVLVTAQAVGTWHRDHPRCPRCGHVSTVIRSGWARQCPEDGSLHFPRTDPAVIVAVTDGQQDPDRERILLGRSALWSGNRYSTLAGFVEPGESAEQAARREVFEESGVRIGAVHYQGSQPWPFPRSLMLGYRAVASTTELVPDGEEIVDLRWFTRVELLAAATDKSIVLPGPMSIAHALIVSWLGQPLPRSEW